MPALKYGRNVASVCTVDPAKVRQTILSMLHLGKAAHLGSSMSMVEMLIAAYKAANIERIKERHPARDRIIVSKGHAAAATYAVMHHYGLLEAGELKGYYQDGSLYAGHVSHGIDYVEHSTGALGHGLSVGCGCALGLRARRFAHARVFVLLGDGEIQEGSIWEAIMYAHHNKLGNLIAMIDNNRISSITHTSAVVNMHPLVHRFAGFGVSVSEVDGHDVEAIAEAIERPQSPETPRVIICNTVKGRGVEFAEEKAIWHYRSLSEQQYYQALAGLLRSNAS